MASSLTSFLLKNKHLLIDIHDVGDTDANIDPGSVFTRNRWRHQELLVPRLHPSLWSISVKRSLGITIGSGQILNQKSFPGEIPFYSSCKSIRDSWTFMSHQQHPNNMISRIGTPKGLNKEALNLK